MSNKPQIITGHVFHERLHPRAHKLKNQVFYLRVPIRTLLKTTNSFDKKCWGNAILGINRKALISVNARDHGDGSGLSVWPEQILKDHGLLNLVDGEIWLSCFPRVLGYQFKPVSFWFCENKAEHLVAILVEVHNTFGERHTYVLTPKKGRAVIGFGETKIATKTFYVSPFLSVEGHYEFRFNFNKKTGHDFQRIDYITDQTVLKTKIQGVASPINTLNSILALLKYPLQSISIITSIHLNAFFLWCKKIPLTLSERKR